MKLICLLLIATITFSAQAKSLYDFKLKTTNQKELNLKDYENKVVLFVNIATQCGYTGQLDGLEKMYQKYKAQNFVIIGIPSNDFGGQTPESNKEVAKFCKLKYGVTFPLTKKTKVTGKSKSEIYQYFLSKTKNVEIEWNFTKILFDKKGQFVQRYPSAVSPTNNALVNDIEKLLK